MFLILNNYQEQTKSNIIFTFQQHKLTLDGL